MKISYKSAESVTEGHPDVICNKIAARILDEATKASLIFKQHPRVAVEVSAKGDLNSSRGSIMLFGEVTLPNGVKLDYEKIARKTIADLGYIDPESGFYHGLRNFYLHISEQSSEINKGVTKKRLGAGDQGLMFGGAVRGEGPEFMPLPIMLAHALTQKLTQAYKAKLLPYLKPDAKAQVVVKYENGKPVEVSHVTISVAHNKKVSLKQLRQDIFTKVIKPTLQKFSFSIKNKPHVVAINAAGPWTVYGPLADAGTTNRKIIVDSYGGAFPHGGGGFNGKDWTKVDVSGALGARFLAKSLVAQNLADKVQVEVCYTIGQPDPKAVHIETFGTEKIPVKQIEEHAKKILDLSVSQIIEKLTLAQPVYAQAAAGGWFGRREFPWEKVEV